MLHGHLWGRGLWSGWGWVDGHQGATSAGMRKEAGQLFTELSPVRTSAIPAWQSIDASNAEPSRVAVTASQGSWGKGET